MSYSKKVQKILKHKMVEGSKLYFVKWFNLGDQHNTWETREVLLNDELFQYLEQSTQNESILPESQHENKNNKDKKEGENDSENHHLQKTRFIKKKQKPKQKHRKIRRNKVHAIEASEGGSNASFQQIEESNSSRKQKKQKRSLQKNSPKSSSISQSNIPKNINIRGRKENISQGEYYKKLFEIVMQQESIIGKEIIFQFKKGIQRFFRVKLQNNQIITLRDDKMKIYFPRLLIDHYRRIISAFIQEV